MNIVVTCFLVTIYVYIATGKKIKPPIPEELKAACRGAGGGKRACLDEKLKEFCQEGSNTDTITCKIVRLKTLKKSKQCHLIIKLSMRNRL